MAIKILLFSTNITGSRSVLESKILGMERKGKERKKIIKWIDIRRTDVGFGQGSYDVEPTGPLDSLS